MLLEGRKKQAQETAEPARKAEAYMQRQEELSKSRSMKFHQAELKRRDAELISETDVGTWLAVCSNMDNSYQNVFRNGGLLSLLGQC